MKSSLARGRGTMSATSREALLFLLALAGRRLRFPSPNFLGALVAVVAAGLSMPVAPAMPEPLFRLALVAVGLSVGRRFRPELLGRYGRAALLQAGLVAGLVAVCLAAGWLFHRATGVPAMTAVLGSTPGGMEVMVAGAAALGADTGLVLTMHLVRWLLVLLVGPWLARRLGAPAGRA